MSANSLIEIVQEGVDVTGMTDVPVEDRTNLLSNIGSGHFYRSFRNYLNLFGIRHILAAPFYPQTSGKLEHYHRSIKKEMNQLQYEVPSPLEKAIGDFVDYYNYRRYHKAFRQCNTCRCLMWQEGTNAEIQEGGTETDVYSSQRL